MSLLSFPATKIFACIQNYIQCSSPIPNPKNLKNPKNPKMLKMPKIPKLPNKPEMSKMPKLPKMLKNRKNPINLKPKKIKHFLGYTGKP